MKHDVVIKTQKKIQNTNIQQELACLQEKSPSKLNNLYIDEEKQPAQITITFRNNSFNNQISSTGPELHNGESLDLGEIQILAILVMITSVLNSLFCFIFAFSDLWPLVIIAFFPTLGYLAALKLNKKLLLAYMLIMAIISILRIALIFHIKRYDYLGLALFSTLLSLFFMVWIIQLYTLLETLCFDKTEEIAELLWGSQDLRSIEVFIVSNLQSSQSNLKSSFTDEFSSNKTKGTVISWTPITPNER